MKISVIVVLILALGLIVVFQKSIGGSGIDEQPTTGIDVHSMSAETADKTLKIEFEIVQQELALGKLVVSASITNQSDRVARFLKWQTPFEESLLGPVYKVSRDDVAVRYVGLMVKRGAPDENQFIVLKPGEVYSSQQSIRSAYDMCDSGRYQIAYDSLLALGYNDNPTLMAIAAKDALSVLLSESCVE